MQRVGRKGRILEMLRPSFKDHIVLRAQFGKGVILMMGRGWFYKDDQTPLTQEYIFTADITLFMSHP